MHGFSRRRLSAWALVAAQVVLLALLAALQYRWTGEVSHAERQRMRVGLTLAAARFSEDFDRELTRIFLFFLIAPEAPVEGQEGPWLVNRLERWRQTAPDPELIRAVWWVSRDSGAPSLRAALTGEELTVEVAPAWPPQLEPVRRRLAELEEGARPHRRGTLRGESRLPFLVPEAAALLVPRLDWRELQARAPFSHFVVVQLDLDELRQEILPHLGRRYLRSGEDSGYSFEVVLADAPAHRVYPAAPGEVDRAGEARGDVEAPLFNLLPPERARDLWFEVRRQMPLPMERWLGGGGRLAPPRPGPRGWPAWLAAVAGQEGGWRLVVRHPEGSLEAAVRRIRRRNLTVSFGVLLLLALTLAMLLLSSRRAQRLAAQQVEFVAGITHELRTPVAAVESLGQNLEDGIVRGEEQVQRYGTLIRKEGARLEHLVDQVLELSGMLSGRRIHDPQPTEVAALVEAAIEDRRPMLEEAGFTIEVEVPPQLPRVEADPAALRRALGNLIHNAVKYADRGKWLGVRARLRQGPGGREVVLEVEDRGPGVPRQDLPHLFEPFYRGRNAREGQIQGSGLGLSLVRHIVEAHGGSIAVHGGPGRGTLFEITLPASPADKREEQDREESPNPVGGR